MDFLQNEREIRALTRKIDRDGYNWGVSGSIGEFTVELITSDEVHFNWRTAIDLDGEKIPTIIIKNTNNPNYPVEAWCADKDSIGTVNGYLLLTEPTIIHPCKTFKEVLFGVRDWIFQ